MGRSEITGEGLVKQAGFKLGVKERGSYGCAEWCHKVTNRQTKINFSICASM